MKSFIHKPVETIAILILIYEFLFSRQWSGVNVWHKISAVIVSITFFLFIYLINISFENTSKHIRFSILKILSNAKNNTYHFSYYLYLILFGLTVVLLISFFEYFSETLLYLKYPPISIGIPFTVYSFSTQSILFRGVFLNTLLYSIIIKMMFESIKKK